MMYLRENAFDEVKLDGSLVRQILENERSRDIVRGITRLAASMQFHVVAALPRIPGACGLIVVSEHDFPPRGVISRYHPNRGFAKLSSIKTV